MHTGSMIRDVEPFNDKEWAWLRRRMSEGPTEEQIRKMDEAGKRIQKLRPLVE